MEPLKLEVEKELAQRSERAKSVDLHPTEPWILASLYSGTVCIWNYQSKSIVKSFKVSDTPVRSAKFIARERWIVACSDDKFIRVYNYDTMEKIKEIEAHTDYIRALAVHPSLPYVLSSSDDMLVKVWDWEKDWTCTETFEGHSHYVMQVAISPSDTNTFASASLDGTIKVDQKAAESLADPEEYPNLFEDWQVALAVEFQVAGTRNTYPPAEEYLNYAERSHVHLVEAFRNMQVDEEEEHLENGDADHEVIEQNGDEESQEESQEGAVVVDADSTDVAVLVNGNEAEEEWGTNNEGTPSA